MLEPSKSIKGLEIKNLLLTCLEDESVFAGLASVFQKLREALPGSSLSLLTRQENKSKAVGFGFASNLLIYPNRLLRYLDAEEMKALIRNIRWGGFDAAILFTSYGQSPYLLAYACYLAGIPIRVGQSLEFGGGVLSHWIKPAPAGAPGEEFLHLVEAVGL